MNNVKQIANNFSQILGEQLLRIEVTQSAAQGISRTFIKFYVPEIQETIVRKYSNDIDSGHDCDDNQFYFMVINNKENYDK